MSGDPSFFLTGNENEYAVSAITPPGAAAVSPADVANGLLKAVKLERRFVPDATRGEGMYLENGGRLYIDMNGHPEYSTPECSSPEEVAAHDMAGDRIVYAALQRIRRSTHPGAVVSKHNIDAIHPDSSTWGCHESHTCWVPLDVAADALIPHLVTRSPFAGSGSLSAHSGGTGFELSQRARHIVLAQGPETTHHRAVFCTRLRKAADVSPLGWIRSHSICKDSQRSSFGVYMTYATTGLLYWFLNHGGAVGKGLALANPVGAMRLVSLDPYLTCRLSLKDGRQLTAIEIQREYLSQCETLAQSQALPPWGAAALQYWRETLDDLDANPLRLAFKLDPYTKLYLYNHELKRAGLDWPALCAGLRLLSRLRRELPVPGLIQALVAQDSALIPEPQALYTAAHDVLHSHGPDALEHLQFAVRMHLLDLKYHELGGLYDQLMLTVNSTHGPILPAQIDEAVSSPPPGGRASARSAQICALHGRKKCVADWQFVANLAENWFIDLSDPFAASFGRVSLSDRPLPIRRP